MTIACAIMTLTISLQWRRIKQQEKLISDFNENETFFDNYVNWSKTK